MHYICILCIICMYTFNCTAVTAVLMSIPVLVIVVEYM